MSDFHANSQMLGEVQPGDDLTKIDKTFLGTLVKLTGSPNHTVMWYRVSMVFMFLGTGYATYKQMKRRR
jgi:hypothetical protein